MATTLDTLLVRIEADLSGLRRDLSKVEGQIKTFGTSATGSLKNLEGATTGASNAFRNLGVAIGAVLGTLTLGKVVSTIREFEDLEARLKSLSPTAEAAAAAMQTITNYSERTTFQVQEVTQAFTTLVSAGIAPTSDVLRDVGNLAAARGKSIQDVAQAILNATTGEFEMLKSLGIVVRTEGDSAVATFKGVSTTINKSNILEYLRQISQTNFGDATDKAAQTLTGRFSNLEDATNRFFKLIGEAGLKKALTDIVKLFTDTVGEGDSLARTIGQSLASAVRGLGSAIVFLKENFDTITKVILVFFAVITVNKILALSTAMITFGLSVARAGSAFAALALILKKNPLTIIAVGLGFLAQVTGVLDHVLEKIGNTLFKTGEATEELKKSQEELNKTIEDAYPKPAEQAAAKFTDAIKGLREEMVAAKLEASGFSKDMVAALKSADMLPKFTNEGLFTGSRKDLEALQSAVDVNEFAKLNLLVFNLRKELALTRNENALPELERQFSQFVGAENLARIKALGIDVSALRNNFILITQSDAIKGITKQLEDMRTEARTTDEFEMFFARLTAGARQVLTDGQLEEVYKRARLVFAEIKGAEKLKGSIDAGVSAVRSFDTEEKRVRQTIGDVTNAFEAGKITADEYGFAIKKLNEQLMMTNPLMKSVGEMITQTESLMTTSLVNIFSGVETISDSFKTFMKNLTNMILQEVTRMLIVVPLMNTIRTALGMATVPTPDQVALAGSYGVIGPTLRATGGAVSSGQATIVGERGPELFIPHSAGSIMNSNNTRSALGGGGGVVVNQTIAVTTGVQATVRAEINNMMPQIADITKAAVAQAATRGGSYRKAFA
jgi:hypothetical protein